MDDDLWSCTYAPGRSSKMDLKGLREFVAPDPDDPRIEDYILPSEVRAFLETPDPPHDHTELADEVYPWDFEGPNLILQDLDTLCSYGVPHDVAARILRSTLETGKYT